MFCANILKPLHGTLCKYSEFIWKAQFGENQVKWIAFWQTGQQSCSCKPKKGYDLQLLLQISYQINSPKYVRKTYEQGNTS